MLLPVASLVAAVAVNPAGLASSASQAASPAASPATCPVTLPNGNEPPPEKHIFGRGAGNYGDVGFQPSGLYFPTAGCWEITGRVGTSSLTFVAIVVPPLLPATPAATP